MADQKMRLVGGPPRRLPMSCYKIIKAESGDSRLMGVLGLYIHWMLKPEFEHCEELEKDFAEPLTDIHQVYCFEIEEDGLDRVSELEGRNTVKLGKMKKNVFGGLGCKMKLLNEREAFYIIDHYSGEAARRFTKMPQGVAQVMELALEEFKVCPFAEDELAVLNRKLCVNIETDFGLVNYYVMRNVCFDREGAELLAAPGADAEKLKSLALSRKSSLIKNRVDLFSKGSTERCYMCESNLDAPDGGWVMISSVTVSDYGVVSSELKKVFKITEHEKYQSLVRSEYVTYFDLTDPDIDAFSKKLEKQIPRASCKMYDNGILFMDYYTTNRHVEQQVFNIGDDLKASYFIAASGQLVMASYSINGIVSAETMVKVSGLDSVLEIRERFNFVNPVLGPFIESGFDNFDDFLAEIL